MDKKLSLRVVFPSLDYAHQWVVGATGSCLSTFCCRGWGSNPQPSYWWKTTLPTWPSHQNKKKTHFQAKEHTKRLRICVQLNRNYFILGKDFTALPVICVSVSLQRESLRCITLVLVGNTTPWCWSCLGPV